MLYLVASGQARERQEVAQLLGVHRNTIGKWMQRYETVGVEGLLEVRVPPRGKPALNEAQVAQVRTALSGATGFGSYGAVQAWILTNFGVSMTYAATYRKLGARLKVARLSHPQKT